VLDSVNWTIFFVSVLFFGTSSKVVVPRDCLDVQHTGVSCADHAAIVAVAASIAVTVPAVQTRWWWFFRGLLLVGAALMSPCKLKNQYQKWVYFIKNQSHK